MLKNIFIFLLVFPLSLHAGVSKWETFSNDSGLIVLPVLIDNEKATVALDTGSNANLISETFLDKHGKDFVRAETAIVSGVNATVTKKLVQKVPIELFGVHFELDDLVPGATDDIDLLLGSGFFKNFIIQIDYPNNRLRLLTRDAIKLKKYANVQTSKAAGSTRPVVKITVNGKDDLWLTFDTGNTGGIIIPRFLAIEKGWFKQNESIETTTQGVNSFSTMDTFNLDTVKIGPFELENAVVSIPKEGEIVQVGTYGHNKRTGSNITSGKKSRGILGYDILKHFIVTIDYKKYLINLSLPK